MYIARDDKGFFLKFAGGAGSIHGIRTFEAAEALGQELQQISGEPWECVDREEVKNGSTDA